VTQLKKIYVGNLPFSTTDDDLRDLFARHGEVSSASVVIDRESGRSRGFGFVEMDTANADTAITALNGRDVGGRSLRVNEAESRRRELVCRPADSKESVGSMS
jgi:RNA recognition motif-containing protein